MHILVTLLTSVTTILAQQQQQQQHKSPNVLFIVADDLGTLYQLYDESEECYQTW